MSIVLPKLKLYLDCCCLNRPFDDMSDEKVRLESEAVLSIIGQCELGRWDLFQSDVLDDEIDRIVHPIKKQQVLELYSLATLFVELNDDVILRAKDFFYLKLGSFDALHLASAEFAGADVILTTDKKFINKALLTDVKIKISNPAIWLMEVLYNDI